MIKSYSTMQENYTCDVAELLRQQTEKANLQNKSLMSRKNLSRLLRRLLPIQKKMPARASFSVHILLRRICTAETGNNVIHLIFIPLPGSTRNSAHIRPGTAVQSGYPAPAARSSKCPSSCPTPAHCPEQAARSPAVLSCEECVPRHKVPRVRPGHPEMPPYLPDPGGAGQP